MDFMKDFRHLFQKLDYKFVRKNVPVTTKNQTVVRSVRLKDASRASFN